MSRKTLVPISHLSSSSDPTVPTLRAGDTYQNSTSKALRTYDGAAWHEHDTLDLATTLSGAKTFTGGVVVNTTGITGNKEINLTGTGASSVGGTLQGTAVIAAGLTGSTAASRYVGATATGAPTTGAHLVGDWVITQDGHIFICTVAGTPGTWANGGAAVTAAVSVTSETTYGIASAVGTSTNYARQDHTHGTPATPATSVAGRTGAVTLTAADIAAGTFPGANTFSGLQTFNAGVTLPSGQALTTGTRSVVTGTRATTTNASDTVDLGTFATTAGTIELRIHAHLVSGAAGATASVTKIYELALNNAMGTTNTWYLCYPADSSANAAASNDFALEVQRTSGTTFNFRFRQKAIAAVGVITWTAETLGDTAVTFTASTTVTAAPAAVSTMHPSNAFVAAAGQIGIGTEAPGAVLDVLGAGRYTADVAGTVPLLLKGAASQSGNLLETRSSANALLAAIASDGTITTPTFGSPSYIGGAVRASILTSNASVVGLVVRGFTSQGANLQEWQSVTPAVVANVTSTGNVQGTGAYTTLSDARGKRNIAALAAGALQRIRALQPRRFDYIDGETGQVGFIAQDVQAVIPEAVVPFGTDTDRLGLRAEAILAHLVLAVQELAARLDTP